MNPPQGRPPTGQPLTTVTFDGDGNVTQQMDGTGATSVSSYDPRGRLTIRAAPLSLLGATAASHSAHQSPDVTTTWDQHDHAACG